MKYLYLSIATTGLDCHLEDIVGISLIIEENNEIIERCTIGIRPRKGRLPSSISEESLRLNGLTVEQLRTFKTPEHACGELLSILKDHSDNGKNRLSIVGHYNIFSYKFIKNFITFYTEYNISDYISAKSIDLKEVAPFVEYHTGISFKDYKLPTLARYFNLELDTTNIESKVNCILNINKKFKELILGEI